MPAPPFFSFFFLPTLIIVCKFVMVRPWIYNWNAAHLMLSKNQPINCKYLITLMLCSFISRPDSKVQFRVHPPKYPLTWMINGIAISRNLGLGVMQQPIRVCNIDVFRCSVGQVFGRIIFNLSIHSVSQGRCYS